VLGPGTDRSINRNSGLPFAQDVKKQIGALAVAINLTGALPIASPTKTPLTSGQNKAKKKNKIIRTVPSLSIAPAHLAGPRHCHLPQSEEPLNL